MGLLQETLENIKQVDYKSMEFARSRFKELYLGIGTLGDIKELVVKFAGIARNEFPKISKIVLLQVGERRDFNKELLEKEKTAQKLLNAELINFDKKEIEYNKAGAINVIESGIKFIKEKVKEEFVVIPSLSLNYENKLAAFCIAYILCKNKENETFENIEYLLKDIQGISVEDIQQVLEEYSLNENNASDVLKKLGTYDIWFTLGIMLGAIEVHAVIILSDWVTLLCALLTVELSKFAEDYFISSQISSLNIHNEISKKLSIHGNVNSEIGILSSVLQTQMLEMAIGIYSESVTKEEVGVK